MSDFNIKWGDMTSGPSAPPKDGEIWNEDGKWFVKNCKREIVAGPFDSHEDAAYAREHLYPEDPMYHDAANLYRHGWRG